MDHGSSSSSSSPSSSPTPTTTLFDHHHHQHHHNHHNNSSNYSCADLVSYEDHRFCILYRFVMYSVVISILVVFGFIGNSLSFCVFGRDKVKTSTLFLFQSLAVIDNLLLVTIFPVYFIDPFVHYVLNEYANDDPFYHDLFAVIDAYIFPFSTVAQTATVWLTVLVAFNRYVAVCKPYKAARLCTVRQAKCQLSVVILFSIIYNLPKFAQPYLEIKTRDDNTTYIKLQARDFTHNKVYINVYESALYLIIMLLLPLVVLNVLNVKLVKALKELSRKRVDMMQSARQKHDNNVTLVLIIVVVVFIVCQTPALANRLMWSFLPECSRECKGFQYFFSTLSNVFAVTNSSVNFIIYLAFNARFRQTICEWPACKCLCSCLEGMVGRCRSKPTSRGASYNNDYNCFTEPPPTTSDKSDRADKSNRAAGNFGNQSGYKLLKLKQLVAKTNSTSLAGNNVTVTSAVESPEPQQSLIQHESEDPSIQVYMGPIKE